MRSIFDQYTQPENRLTHALVCALAEDARLLKRFLRWIGGIDVRHVRTFEVLEQGFPGHDEIPEDEAGEKGLPDAWIHDGDAQCVLIESKIGATLRADQLRRHYKTASRHGFSRIRLLALGPRLPRGNLPKGTTFHLWSDIYLWLRLEATASEWARRVADFMDVAEAKWSTDGYLVEGTLTVFSGIPFDGNNPYRYSEAKRLLKLALDELRTRNELRQTYGIDPTGKGRSAITGTTSRSVWDFISLVARHEKGRFTRYPHLTLAITDNKVIACVIFPNGLKGECRNRLRDLPNKEFSNIIRAVTKRILRQFGRMAGVDPWLELVQRHYLSQRSIPHHDAKLIFDPSTAFHDLAYLRKGVHYQPQWLATVYQLMRHKRSNLQLAIGATFSYEKCRAIHNRTFLDCIAKAWIACKPIVDVTLAR